MTRPGEGLKELAASRSNSMLEAAASLTTNSCARPTGQEVALHAAAAAELAGLGYWRLDFPSETLTWSRSMYTMYGVDRSHPINADCVMAMTHPEDLGLAQTRLNQILAGQTIGEQTLRIVRPDGGIRWVVSHTAIVKDDNGRGLALMGTLIDVTNQKKSALLIAEGEARYRLLTENSHDVAFKFSTLGLIQYVSPSIMQLLGYDPEDLIGGSGAQMIYPPDLENCRKAFGAALFGNEVARTDYRLVHKNGTPVWVDARPRPHFDEVTGAIIGVTDVVRDIAARKAAEIALASSEARYRLLADNTTDLVLKTDKSGVIEYASPGSRLFGYEPQDLVSRKGLDFLHPDDIAFAKQMIVDVYEGENISLKPNREYRFRCKDGRYVWLEGNPTLIHDALGEPVAVVSALRDVSRRRALEDSLAEARDLAEAATVAKSEFLANMSHEIRTPLTAIIGFSGLLSARNDLPEPAWRMVQRLKGAGSALLSLVNDILDFSALEASQMVIEPRSVDIVTLAKDALLMLEPQAEGKLLTLHFEADTRMPEKVSVDPDRLRQILLNLIGNAVKFTDGGGVRVILTYNHGEGTAGFRVEDTGKGIDETQRLRLFQKFSQGDGSSTRRYGGTGVGLVICKGLVEAMGGQIDVESKPGEGSTFYFYIYAPIIGGTILTNLKPRELAAPDATTPPTVSAKSPQSAQI